MATNTKPQPRIAACAVALTAGGELQLTPAGEFRGRDGRPVDAPCWRIDANSAQQVIARASSRKTRIVVDYDHQTLNAPKNGQPAPAAAWFYGTDLEWREGQGLFATNVQWTKRAAAMVAADEYAYISPVFPYDADGTVTDILMAGLTNFPNLDGLDEVALAVAANTFFPDQTTENSMELDEETIQQLRWMLNLPLSATAADIKAELLKLADRIKETQPEAVAANSIDLKEVLTSSYSRIAELSAQIAAGPDLSKYVPLAHVQALQAELAKAQGGVAANRGETLITAAMQDGRLPPSLEPWARGLVAANNFEALETFLASAPVIVKPGTTQSAGAAPAVGGPAQLNETQVAVCRQLGISPDNFRAQLDAEAHA